MNIDSHQHFWKYDVARDAWITEAMSVLKRDFLPDELHHELELNGIDGSVVVQVDQSEAETHFLLRLAEQDVRIVGVVGWVDLCLLRIEERLQYFSQFKKLCGFRHIAQAEPDDRYLVRNDFLHGIGMLRELGFTYDILIFPKQLPAAIELASHFPEQRFVLDHLAKPEIKAGKREPWATQIRTLAQNKNVFCKVSGMVTEADWRRWNPDDFRPYLDVVFEAFGPERLMFGSDWPVCLLAASYGQVKQLVANYVNTLSLAASADIFGGNAIRFYSLEAALHGFAA
ncbi:MAG TPA: amidohydrolase family protein [Candidatus Solibacter sp.]|nr:amidohydrolase family protein [Candidatus Solibacter sp.]